MLFRSNQPGVLTAQVFLDSSTYHNTENLSRLIIAKIQAGKDASGLVTELLLNQNFDGGFGELPGYGSTHLDTAMALEAISTVNGPLDQVTASAVFFLLNQQQNDGGWAEGNNETSVYVSALVMRALWFYRDAYQGVRDSLVGADQFLQSKRNINTGLWDNSFESALALIAMIPNTTQFSKLESILTALRAQQRTNGSWDDSVYATSLALRAIASQPTITPATPTTGVIKGRVLDNTAISKLPIVDALIQVDGQSITGNTDAAGNFTLAPLTPGEYVVRVSASGYGQVVYNATVTAGAEVNLGDVLLQAAPATGNIQGKVTDTDSGLLLSGVLVTVSGSTSVSSTTNADGTYNLTGLNPGSISIILSKTG